jgi:hypothetical protein
MARCRAKTRWTIHYRSCLRKPFFYFSDLQKMSTALLDQYQTHESNLWVKRANIGETRPSSMPYIEDK